LSNVIFADGAALGLATTLESFEDPILLVTGGESFTTSGAEDLVLPQLARRRSERYVVSNRLPDFVAANDGIGRLQGSKPGVVLAVGGGAVIDTAKLIALIVNNPSFEGDEASAGLLSDAVELVALPTTSGSGSERTPFAVAYRGSIKLSISHPSMRPVCAIVDPTLTHSMSPELTASSGLDVLAHAMESSWSAAATEESLEHSFQALERVWASIEDAVNRPTRASRHVMAEASTIAGAAIAIAKTTASHALSYYLTAIHGVPHGVAAAMTLGEVLVLNAGVAADNISGPRSPADVTAAISRVCEIIGANAVEDARDSIRAKISSIGVATTLSDLGVTDQAHLAAMAAAVNKERLGNNPRVLSASQLAQIVAEVA
jgi:alcohol dehydrogenase class IV